MKIAATQQLESDREEREQRPTLGLAPADANRLEREAHSDDATQGAQVGSEPYDDATQGRQIGSRPYDDATQARGHVGQ